MDDIELLLPEIGPEDLRDLSTSRIRQQAAYQQRLPSIPGLSVERFYMADRGADALEYAIATGLANDQLRKLAVIMRAKQRAEERLTNRIVEGRGSYVEFM